MGVYGFVALLFALAADPALADLCNYSDGTSDNGPCIEVRNGLGHGPGSREMNLWCTDERSHISKSHKIILRENPGSSFTCRGNTVKVQRVQADCNFCWLGNSCGGKKTTLTLEWKWKWHNKLDPGVINEIITETCQ